MSLIENLNPAFHEYFQSIYQDRWPQIFQALSQEPQYIHRPNLFYKPSGTVLPTYKMDPASQIVAQAVDVQPNDRVLDMCAAPGGKSLILAEKLDSTGELISNEFSASRRERLMRVFREYIPQEQRQNVFVQGKDGQMFGIRTPDYFDRVLADVPCSGERHLLENKTEFKKWTLKRTRNLAVRQFSLLSSAWLSCKNGGRIVYSTCSISPLENDEVIRKLVGRRGVEILFPYSDLLQGVLEKTEFGYQILPDKTGFGPMYFSVMTKKN